MVVGSARKQFIHSRESKSAESSSFADFFDEVIAEIRRI